MKSQNDAVYWAVGRAVGGAVTDAVIGSAYWAVDRAVYRAVYWAVGRAVYGAEAAAVRQEPEHPALADYLREVSPEAGVA